MAAGHAQPESIQVTGAIFAHVERRARGRRGVHRMKLSRGLACGL
jgi:hypothetical protein